ncbi:MAG: DNA repair protein RecN [Bacteroidota bacterium]
MIERLHIRNYAIIEEVEIKFSKGLTIITGETGAGKSIILGALGLIMGRRADTRVLYNKESKCVVEAHFKIHKQQVKAFFQANDLDYDSEVIIRRELSPSGKSRAFINDTPVKLPLLKELSAALIDLHQQFDTMELHQASFQLQMLDALADNGVLLANYQQDFQAYKANVRRLESLRQQDQQAAQEIDYYTFLLEEFEKADLEADEQESLEQEQQLLENAEGIKSAFTAAYMNISESEDAISGRLRELNNLVSQHRDINPEIGKITDRMDSLLLEAEDIADELKRIEENTEFNPERLEEIGERLNMIYRLQNKHQVRTIGELLELQGDLALKVEAFSDLGGTIANLEAQIDALQAKLLEKAQKLSKRRQAVIQTFEMRIHSMLEQLSMEHARLQINIQEDAQLNAYGIDQVNFLFAANKGGRFESIKDVASGGELSRLTLVTKSLVASAIPLPTMIFDEIDTGVSGNVAMKMGEILRGLADEHQVVVITHTPQVASKANKHYFVYKQVIGESTFTKVKKLDKEARVFEIATMLSGNPPTKAAVENAKQLIATA